MIGLQFGVAAIHPGVCELRPPIMIEPRCESRDAEGYDQAQNAKEQNRFTRMHPVTPRPLTAPANDLSFRSQAPWGPIKNDAPAPRANLRRLHPLPPDSSGMIAMPFPQPHLLQQ